MNEQILMQMLEESGALRRGHFLLSSGLHSSAYVQCALLLEDPVRARKVGQDLAELLRHVPPRLGAGARRWAASSSATRWRPTLGVPFRFTERKGEEMGLRRGFTLRQGERVVIVEDVVTTGRSTLETAALATARGARVVAIGAIIDRTAGRDPFDVPFRALLQLDLPSYSRRVPVLPRRRPPAEKPGSRPEAAAEIRTAAEEKQRTTQS